MNIWLNRTLKLRAKVGFVSLFLMVLILAISNQTIAQIKTSVRYSEDITRQIATARQLEQ